MWDDSQYCNSFWHIAYHALFYTHLYLQPTEEDFVPWAGHRENYQFMGRLPWPPHEQPEIGEPYAREEVLAYLEHCRQQVATQVPGLDLDAPSGFDWIPLNKMELQLYNLRHLQHHTGELCERLGEKGDVQIEWVGRGQER